MELDIFPSASSILISHLKASALSFSLHSHSNGGTNKVTFTLGLDENCLASSLFIVDKPPFTEHHSVARRVTCNFFLCT